MNAARAYLWWTCGFMAGGFLTQLDKGDVLGMIGTGLCALANAFVALMPAVAKATARTEP